MATLGEMFGAGGASTFFDLPEADWAALSADIVLFGAAGATPYPSVGFYCAGGPQAIRAAAVAYGAARGHMHFDLGGPMLPPGLRVVDAGDLDQDPRTPEANRGRIRAATETILAAGAVPILVGGDDSLPIPMLEGLAALGRTLTILQIDAHIDWRDEVQGERLGLSSPMRRASEMVHVARIIQVGQRGIGSARVEDVAEARAWGVQFVPMAEIARQGLGRALASIPEGGDVVICLDLDALDPGIMPAVIGRTAGGLGYWDIMDLVEGVAAKARIVAFDMVEFMPERDIDGQGALTAAQLLAGVLGVIARQRG
ncbi:arginase family protein [Stagnihabitans tardus]|uniref:Arginase n=1 Tax=Stagnihabitans tardus TaxID=2699202 RepID=A0AAE5BUF2_9RHOB|nr:arginase family protein [Stagnihabitans tardus]NBZ86043.1 arginase [Stagnihabitans tardus]